MPAFVERLTREAALEAGLPENVILLEEPQAALYAWLADMGDAWRRKLNVGDTLLVCDVGGFWKLPSIVGYSVAAELLFNQLNGQGRSKPSHGDKARPQHIKLDNQLVLRNSCGCKIGTN